MLTSSSTLNTLFLSEHCPLSSYRNTKVVSAIIKIVELNKAYTSSLIFHVSQASQDDSKKKTSELLSSILSYSESSQDGLGQNQGAAELEQATRELSDCMKPKRGSMRHISLFFL